MVKYILLGCVMNIRDKNQGKLSIFDWYGQRSINFEGLRWMPTDITSTCTHINSS